MRGNETHNQLKPSRLHRYMHNGGVQTEGQHQHSTGHLRFVLICLKETFNIYTS